MGVIDRSNQLDDMTSLTASAKGLEIFERTRVYDWVCM